MKSVLRQRLSQLAKSKGHLTLKGALHGIEKEGLRVLPSGQLSRRPHPDSLGSPLTNSSVTTDFSESLLELITPVFKAPETALDYLKNVHQFTYKNLGNELIWAGSMPCAINDPATIPIADFGSSNRGMMKHLYRVGLKNRYGSLMQSIAGIHYNFSLPEEFWRSHQQQQKNSDSLEIFRSLSYFTLIRNFRRHSWLLLYLFGASPALSDTFMAGKNHGLELLHEKTLYLPHATSLRMSDLGYSTNAQSSLSICFNHLSTYTKSLYEAIHTSHQAYEAIGVKVNGHYRQLATTILQIENEYYSDIRPKRVPRGEETSLQALRNGGVEYIEVRNTDINPFLSVGIDAQQALFMDTFLLTCLLMNDDLLSPDECKFASSNLQKVTTKGREVGLKLHSTTGEIDLKDAGETLIADLKVTAELLDDVHNTKKYSHSVSYQVDKLRDSSLTPSARVVESLMESGLEYEEWILEKSTQHKNSLQIQQTDKQIQKLLVQIADDSKNEQKIIEDSDTIGFDEYLLKARTGDTEKAAK